MEKYSQRKLIDAAPSGAKEQVGAKPVLHREIPVPPRLIDTIREGTELAKSPEDTLCQMEELSGLSALRVRAQQMLSRVIGGETGNETVLDGVIHGNHVGIGGKINLIDESIKPEAFTMPDDNEED